MKGKNIIQYEFIQKGLIMNRIGIYNLIAIIIGLSIIGIGLTVSYVFQKYYFSKYKNKVRNTINKDEDK